MPKALSHKVEDMIHFCRGRKELLLADFLDQLGTTGSAVLTMIFSIPFLFFAWIPVMMTVFGVIIFISGICLALNKPIWVPSRLRKKKISADKMAHRLVKWVKCLKRCEKTVHPRGILYQHSPFLQTLNGFILSLCGLFLFLPLSPVSNFLPALGVFLLSIGVLEEDLGVMIAAYIVLTIKVLKLFLPLVV